MMKAKFTYVIVCSLIVVSIILAYDAFTSYINPYLSVSEICTKSASYIDKKVQVLGTAVNGSSGWTEDGSFIFNLTDGQYTIRVTYGGNLPQGFNEGQQVVAIGNLVSANNLDASEMLIKCPSKYEGGEASLLADPVFLIAITLGSAALIYYVASTLLKRG